MPQLSWRRLRTVPDQLCEAAPVRLTGLDTAPLCLDRDVTDQLTDVGNIAGRCTG